MACVGQTCACIIKAQFNTSFYLELADKATIDRQIKALPKPQRDSYSNCKLMQDEEPLSCNWTHHMPNKKKK